MKLRRSMIISLALILFLTGCKGDKKSVETAKEEPIKGPAQEEQLPADPEYAHEYPLTGIGTNESIDARSVAVMINNHPKARPQSGIHQADLVFELLAEGDVTRFLAIFQSEQPDKIGPIRSARDYFIDLAKGYKSLYIAHGYSPEAKKMLDSGYIDDLNGMVYDGSLFKRASHRKAPHNSYITFENILKGAEKNKFSMKGEPAAYKFYQKNEMENLTGEAAESLMVSYFSSALFNVIYEYDESSGKYKRFSNGEQTIDFESKAPVLLDNIIIIEMEHKVIDSKGRRSINLTTGGNGYMFQKGKWNSITWKNVDGQIIPFLNGEQAKLVPGKTWVNVIPTDRGLQKSVSINAK